MAKSMARIENGVVINIEIYADEMPETEVLINTNNKLVGIGNKYIDGKFYTDDNNEILSMEEILQNKVCDYESILSDIELALGVK